MKWAIITLDSIPTTIYAASVEELRVEVSACYMGEVQDPSTLEASLAITQSRPVDEDWYSATWETVDAAYFPDRYYLTTMIGAEPFALDPGEYGVWAKITQDEQIVIRRAGTLLVI